ncbi:hypothetical protein Tco_1509861 [Tanacetum coccineum]
MTAIDEFMILSGAENHPPMLDKDLYDFRKSRMELYMQNREHRIMILESVKHGPLIWPTIEENYVTRIKKYEELSATKKIQADCDLKETNIILQGLPSDVYSLVNHHKVSKDLWERIQLLMQSTSLIKHEKECKLYDAFDKFAHIKGESLHRQQATVHGGRVTVQPVQGRQSSFAVGISETRANISGTGGNNSGQQRVVKCFNCQGEGSGKVLNKEELEFLADPGVVEGPVTQRDITYNAAYQADDLDAYDFDDFSTAKAVLMANLSSYGSDVLFEVPHFENTHNDMLNQSVQEIPYSEQTHLVNYLENEIIGDSKIIPYSQYQLET